jgi:urease accessory protein
VIEAQTLLGRALPIIADVSSAPVADDAPIRSFTPLAEIAVALHGSSGQRLFSN